uniref:EF-hand domain-containing protein n=1 Tax=Branchiostoma floridae TaxID=7739 RepID=C3YFC2_BRAFL|eukprot:XP_002604875.1 hypothetical protein BRAFLDRAFT_77290 [Branchiostoma floridae]
MLLRAISAVSMSESADRKPMSAGVVKDVAVNQDFLRFLRKINKLKGRNMTAIYGFVQRKVMKQEWQQPLEDPRRIFQDYILRNHLRISDVFRRFDKKQNMVITVEEFRTGMKESNIIMEPWQLERLIQKLDSDGDGLIDYSDLLEGQRKLVHKERRQLKRKLTKKKIKVEEKKQVLEQMDVALRAKPPKEPVPPWKAVSKLALLAARSNSRDSRRSSVLQTPKLPALNEGQVVTTAVNRWVALTAQRAGASSQASPRTTSQLSLRTTSQLAPHLQPILKVPDDPETTEQPTLPEQPTRKVSGIIAVDRMPPFSEFEICHRQNRQDDLTNEPGTLSSVKSQNLHVIIHDAQVIRQNVYVINRNVHVISQNVHVISQNVHVISQNVHVISQNVHVISKNNKDGSDDVEAYSIVPGGNWMTGMSVFHLIVTRNLTPDPSIPGGRVVTVSCIIRQNKDGSDDVEAYSIVPGGNWMTGMSVFHLIVTRNLTPDPSIPGGRVVTVSCIIRQTCLILIASRGLTQRGSVGSISHGTHRLPPGESLQLLRPLAAPFIFSSRGN